MLSQCLQQHDIDREQAISNIDDDFECLICKNIVQSPVSCG